MRMGDSLTLKMNDDEMMDINYILSAVVVYCTHLLKLIEGHPW